MGKPGDAPEYDANTSCSLRAEKIPKELIQNAQEIFDRFIFSFLLGKVRDNGIPPFSERLSVCEGRSEKDRLWADFRKLTMQEEGCIA